MPGALLAPIASRGNRRNHTSFSHYRSSRITGIPRATVDGLYAISPVSMTSESPSPTDRSVDLTPAKGCQDHAILPYATFAARRAALSRPSHPASRS